jgi:hypothetical protein
MSFAAFGDDFIQIKRGRVDDRRTIGAMFQNGFGH